ncbi:MAG: class I SAM-dependent methyltransferase, partial [Acidiferrobacterales bacterium]
FIRRMEAQRSCLNLAAELVNGLDGPILELGLGNARTYDHLRHLFPSREFFVFDQRLRPLPNGVLDCKHLILGDIRDTLPAAVRRFGHRIILVHSDMGSGQKEPNTQLTAFITSQLPSLMQPSGLVVADQDVAFERSTRMSLPDDVAPGRYFMYRAG